MASQVYYEQGKFITGDGKEIPCNGRFEIVPPKVEPVLFGEYGSMPVDYRAMSPSRLRGQILIEEFPKQGIIGGYIRGGTNLGFAATVGPLFIDTNSLPSLINFIKCGNGREWTYEIMDRIDILDQQWLWMWLVFPNLPKDEVKSFEQQLLNGEHFIREVYADWLEERGALNRAEEVRIGNFVKMWKTEQLSN